MTDLLLRHGRVLDVVAGDYLGDHDVLVRDGRIAAVGRSLPDVADVPVVDLAQVDLVVNVVVHHKVAVVADLVAAEDS